jgi:glycosyltransferase involved in cell wall biosynthesis
MMAHPKISVVMTSYNYARFIEEAVRSVWNQRYENLELVVVDDASTDNTPQILSRLREESPVSMRVILNVGNLGPNATQNIAVNESQGEYLAFLGSDDKFLPERFDEQVTLLNQQPDLVLVYSNGWRMDSAGNRTRKLHSDGIAKLLCQPPEEILTYLYTNTSPLFLQTALIRRDFFLMCGGNDESVLADDWVLNIKFFEAIVRGKGRFAYLDREVACYRVHESNLHKDLNRQLRLREEVIRKYTPTELRRTAHSNVYWKQGMGMLEAHDVKGAMKLLAQSIRLRPLPRRVASLVWLLMSMKVFRCRVR